MKLLILTQYYPPEIGAPQNRLHELAIRLKAEGIEVEVLTGLPNYPEMRIHEEYLHGKKREEIIDGVRVYRAGIYVSSSKGIVGRLRNYFSFVYSSWRRGRKLGNYDFLMVESPPLFLGYSAMRLARKLNAKLIFNVSDLWPESAEKLGIVTNKMLLGMAYRLEAKCYQRSALVSCQTMGIVQNINDRFPGVKTFWLPNGVDTNFYNPEKHESGDLRSRLGLYESDLLFFYGGILGHAQGLEVILYAADKLRNYHQVKFVLQGAGPEREKLLALKENLKLDSVYIVAPVPKSDMPGILKAIDVAIVPLRKLNLFEGAIPSKIFEAQAMKVPLLLGVKGEAHHHFIEKGEGGLYFEPENAEELARQLIYLVENPAEIQRLGENARKYVDLHFNRNIIAQAFCEKLRNLG